MQGEHEKERAPLLRFLQDTSRENLQESKSMHFPLIAIDIL
jgi:hypothetical protein